MKNERCTAVVLAAGNGSRMKSNVAKQFLTLAGKPLIYYALRAVEESKIIDDCILVTGENDIPYVQKEIVEEYHFGKVRTIVPGGSERCYSVANAMKWIAQQEGKEFRADYVFIHDGARPFLTEEILQRTFETVKANKACVAAVPSKDTVKIVDSDCYAVQTPDRKTVWTVQTPQVFEKNLIVEAYAQLSMQDAGKVFVTDDASVVELFTDCKVKMAEGDYRNIKVTTPEDMVIAEALLRMQK